jgi:hypothetical protein
MLACAASQRPLRMGPASISPATVASCSSGRVHDHGARWSWLELAGLASCVVLVLAFSRRLLLLLLMLHAAGWQLAVFLLATTCPCCWQARHAAGHSRAVRIVHESSRTLLGRCIVSKAEAGR